MAETVLSDAPPEQQSEKPESFWTRLAHLFTRQREASILVVVIVLFIYFAIVGANQNFVSLENIRTIAQYLAPSAIVAIGEVFLMTCGEIDISVGSVVAMTPYIMYNLNQVAGIPLILSIILGLLCAAIVGFINGAATVWFKIPSLIATLGTQFLILGVTLTISQGEPVIPPEAGVLSQIFGRAAYSELIWAIVLAIVFQVILSLTRWGKHTVAAGGNLLGSREAGVAVNRIKFINFMVVSIFGGLVGIMEGYRIDSIDPSTGGVTLMFNAVAGAVIGGTSLVGGVGTVAGALLGVMALSILQDGFTLLGVSAYVYDIILGVAILIAMVLNLRISSWREGRR